MSLYGTLPPSLRARVSAPVLALSGTVLMVGVGLTILWRYRLLAAFFASFGFQVTAFVLALLAIIFGCIQFWDSRRHSEKMELIARSMSTRYLGIFPKEMDEIIDLIDLADKELIIISDFVDYGAYSRPETYQRLFDAVMRARDRGVSVQWLVYSEGPAQQTLVNQFKDDFARISNDPKFINYFNYWRGIDKPHDHATFLPVSYTHLDVYKRQVLSLRVRHPQGALRVDIPKAGAPIEVGGSPPVTRDKIAPHAHHVSEIAGLSSPRNRDHRSAELKIPIAAQNQGTLDLVELPSQRTNDGHQRVFKRVELILIAEHKVERKRDIDGEPSYILGKFELVSIKDVSVEVGRFGSTYFFIRQLDI